MGIKVINAGCLVYKMRDNAFLLVDSACMNRNASQVGAVGDGAIDG